MELKHIKILLLILSFYAGSLSCGKSLFTFAKNYERGSAQLAEKSVQAGDHNIVYLEGGTGPTILLVHGFAGDKDNWTRFAKFLTGKYRVIAVDLPGFGESTRIKNSNYNVENQTARLEEFTNALKLNRFHLAGNSMGGWISAYYAIKYPSKIISLTLIDSGGVNSSEKSEMFLDLEKGFNPLLVKDVKDYDRMLNFLFVEKPYIPDSIKEEFSAAAVRNREFDDKIFSDLMTSMLNIQPLLNKIKSPALIIWGEKDRVIHISCAEIFTKGITGSKSYILKNCGHLPMIERPEETSKVFLEFIGSLNE